MKKGLKTDFTNPKVKTMGAKPFATNWSNSRPLANMDSVVSSPGGDAKGRQPQNMGKKGRTKP